MVLQIAHLLASCGTTLLMLHKFVVEVGKSKAYFLNASPHVIELLQGSRFLGQIILWQKVHGLLKVA